MNSLISEKRNFQSDKYLKWDSNADAEEINLLLVGSSIVIIDIANYDLLDRNILRAIIESDKVFFTALSLEAFLKNTSEIYISQDTFKVIGQFVSTDYNIEIYDENEVYEIKETKLAILDEVKMGLSEIKDNKRMIWKSAYSNFILETKNTTLGSYWHIVRDVIFFVTYISFMTFMRGNSDIEELPGIVYLVVGLVPWYFVSDIFNGGVNCIRGYRHVISKVKFPITIIPFYNTIGSFYKRGLTYLILAFVILVYFILGDIDTFKVFHFIYFNAAMIIYMMAFNLVFSSLISVSKDFGELYKSIQRVQFYFIPVFWDFTMIASKLNSADPIKDFIGDVIHMLLLLNPVAYILNGFRMSFGGTNHVTTELTIIFWVMTIIMFIVGFSLQARLRKIYADVL